MQENAEAADWQRAVDALIGDSLTAEDDALAQQELDELEKEVRSAPNITVVVRTAPLALRAPLSGALPLTVRLRSLPVAAYGVPQLLAAELPEVPEDKLPVKEAEVPTETPAVEGAARAAEEPEPVPA
eukprot:scaffold3429_cov339-Prasinococcus_capsulatus_cf.AAC.4